MIFIALKKYSLLLAVLLLPACHTGRDAVTNSLPPDGAGIIFGGDVMLDWGVGDMIEKEGYKYPFKNIRNFLSGFDYRFCNLECPVSEEGEPHPDKKYIFLGRPEYLDALVYGGINGVSLANNHTNDFGKTAFVNTMTSLSEKGIAYTGAGMDIGAAHLPLSVNIRGIRIAVFAYSFIADNETFATGSAPGITGASLDIIKEDIAQFEPLYDFIIISVHWGNEYSDYPCDEQIDTAHSIIDAGADAIIGHHPHVYQGIEIYKNRPVFYSLGNFLFGSINEDIRDNILVDIKFLKNGLAAFNVHLLSGNKNSARPFQPDIIEGPAARAVFSHLLGISRQIGSDFPDNAVTENSRIAYYFKRK